MGPKKKGKDEEEDTSTKDLLTYYKKNCKELEVPVCKFFEAKLNEVLEEDSHLPEILINEKIGEFGARALANALIKTNKQKGYRHLQSIRIWDGEMEDEGVRAFQQYMTDTFNSTVSIIELLNCGISPLGCEFISRMFHPQLPSKISILTLDYNNFGNEGLSYLMSNMKENRSLQYLSLAYCNIDEGGLKWFDDYLKSPSCNLKKLIIQGNPLKNSGVTALFTLLYLNYSIEEINLNNVQFGNDPEGSVTHLAEFMGGHADLKAYSLKFNFINDEDFEVILKALRSESCKHIYQFLLDEKVEKTLFDEYFKIMKNRKKKPARKNKKK